MAIVDGWTKARLAFADLDHARRVARPRRGEAATRDTGLAASRSLGSCADADPDVRLLLERASARLADGGVLQIFTDWRRLDLLQNGARAVGLTILDVCVWSKDRPATGDMYRSKFELVVILKKGDAPHTSNIGQGKGRRARSNIWDYPNDNPVPEDQGARGRPSRHGKPVAFIADAISDVTHLGDVLVDGFSDAESTILAAEQTMRCAYAIEPVPAHVDAVLHRWRVATGVDATHAETGQTFAAVADARTRPQSAARH